MLRRAAFLLSIAVLAACAGSPNSTPPNSSARAQARSPRTISDSARFFLAPSGNPSPCADGVLNVSPNPVTVHAGGTAVVNIAACNAAAGDRMAAYIDRSDPHNPMGCSATDSTLGTSGDGGSDPNDGNFAVIAGSSPCPDSKLEITDISTGAINEVYIAIATPSPSPSPTPTPPPVGPIGASPNPLRVFPSLNADGSPYFQTYFSAFEPNGSVSTSVGTCGTYIVLGSAAPGPSQTISVYSKYLSFTGTINCHLNLTGQSGSLQVPVVVNGSY